MPSIREGLTAALAASSEAAPATTAAAPEAVSGAVPMEGQRLEEQAAVPEGAHDEPSRQRDGKGRFAPGAKEKAPESSTKAAAEATPAKSEAPATAEPAAPKSVPKAPQSWRPGVREKWAGLPPEVQEEVARVESTTQKALREAAAHRKVAEEFTRTLEPYRDLLGQNPTQELGGMLQTVRALQGPDSPRVVANLIRAYRVDVNQLAAALDGEAPPPRQQQPQEFRDPRLDSLLQRFDSQSQQQQEALNAKVATEVQSFREKPEAEFFEDVREEMALVLQTAAKRGERPTIEQVYERACMLNPEVRELYVQRKAARAASARAPTTAPRKSSSLRHESTAPAPAEKPKGVRAHLLNNLARLSGG